MEEWIERREVVLGVSDRWVSVGGVVVGAIVREGEDVFEEVARVIR